MVGPLPQRRIRSVLQPRARRYYRCVCCEEEAREPGEPRLCPSHILRPLRNVQHLLLLVSVHCTEIRHIPRPNPLHIFEDHTCHAHGNGA